MARGTGNSNRRRESLLPIIDGEVEQTLTTTKDLQLQEILRIAGFFRGCRQGFAIQ
jgi:hypothetical protein